MPTTQGRIIPNNSSEAVSVLEVWVKPTLDRPCLLIEFNTGSGIAHNVVETKLMHGFDGTAAEPASCDGDQARDLESTQDTVNSYTF